MKHIVARNGARMELASEVGKGTEIRIYFDKAHDICGLLPVSGEKSYLFIKKTDYLGKIWYDRNVMHR